jgi:hypothetical protein
MDGGVGDGVGGGRGIGSNENAKGVGRGSGGRGSRGSWEGKATESKVAVAERREGGQPGCWTVLAGGEGGSGSAADGEANALAPASAQSM